MLDRVRYCMHTQCVQSKQQHNLTERSTKQQKRLVFFLDTAVFSRLRRFAFDREKTQADIMRRALVEHMDREEKRS